MKPAGPSPGRQGRGGGGLIEGETRGGGRKRERKRGVRHTGCMATQAALLYQEVPVGPFLPKLC